MYYRRTIERASASGTWLWVIPTHDNGMVLTHTEWRDGCFLRYARTPPDLPATCYGCGSPFSFEHGQTCKKGASSYNGMMRSRTCSRQISAVPSSPPVFVMNLWFTTITHWRDLLNHPPHLPLPLMMPLLMQIHLQMTLSWRMCNSTVPPLLRFSNKLPYAGILCAAASTNAELIS